MKKIAIIIVAISGFFLSQVTAQAPPQRFQYQAVARDANNGLLTNATINIQILIHQSGSGGQVVYQEEHTTITNEFGQFTLEIGGGTPLMGVFSNIIWGSDTYWMEVLMQPNPVTGYLNMGATQLLSVPYALFAANAANASSQWLNNPNGIHYTNGRVGIGTGSPDFKLDIRGFDSDAEEDMFNIRKDAASGAGRNFRIKIRPAIPEVLLTTDGASGASPRLTLGPAGGISSFLTIQPNENSGINTNTPEAGLDILRSNGAPALRVTKSAGQEHIAIFRRDPAPGVQPAMVITRQGFVGIGTDAPSQELHVIGSICYTGSSTSCSDGRYKQDIQPIAGALEKLSRINGRYYHWKQADFPEKKFSTQRQIGVIAQEVEPYFPELVFTDPDGYKSVDYARLTPVLIEALKEQQVQIEALKTRLSLLEQLEERLSALEQSLKQLEIRR